MSDLTSFQHISYHALSLYKNCSFVFYSSQVQVIFIRILETLSLYSWSFTEKMNLVEYFVNLLSFVAFFSLVSFVVF